MYDAYTQNRIANLRTQKGVSARDMSLSLGQNSSYINQIENHKALCDYFGITPRDFFDEKNANPAQLSALIEDLKRLDETSLQHIAAIVKEIIRAK